MAYSLEYQLNHDIDIFFELERCQLIHIATAGAKLPRELASFDSMILKNKKLILDLKKEYEVMINPYLDELLKFKNNREKDLYLSDFRRIASKGIISFDKTIVEDSNDPFFHVVAFPSGRDHFNHLINPLPIDTPDFISKSIQENIKNNILESNQSGKRFDKFELLKGI